MIDRSLDHAYTHLLLDFGRLLRDAGLRVTTGQILDLCRALNSIDITNREEFYQAARCLLLTRHQDEQLFRALFVAFWQRQQTRAETALDRDTHSDLLAQSSPSSQPSDGGQGTVQSQRLLLSVPEESGDDSANKEEDGDAGRDQLAAYSATEVLRRKDFSELQSREIAEVNHLIAELRFQSATRKLRRTRRAPKGPHPDPRRALRETLSHGGELMTLPRREQRRKARPLVLICDISGSMERYTSLLLRFLHAIRQGRGSVETFVFGTRLTRITRQLRLRDTDQALREVSTEVIDWGGGTRIGESLATFNRRWGRRVLGHGALVAIISDGWDHGDPAILAAELSHLQRLSHRLIWLNPLLGLSGYAPLTRGMRAALPFVDDFMTCHTLQSLQDLAHFLAELDDHRPERGHQHTMLASI